MVRVRVSSDESTDRISVLEHRAPYGDSPPLHIHHTEDEVFIIFESRVRFSIEGTLRHAGPGDVLVAPKGIPHTYRMDSREGVHWLTITRGGDFERFVRAVSRQAARN
jgi:quercetin dioxygenase-like cupin family protein